MALLDVVKDAAVLVGLSPPSTVASSIETESLEFLTLATMAGRELSRWHDWQSLSVAGTFTGNGVATSFALPADFDRFAPGQAMMLDGGAAQVARGPLDRTAIAAIRASTPTIVSWLFYRRGNSIVFSTPPENGRLIVFEYQSRRFVRPVAGADKERFTADTDTSLIDEGLLTLMIVWMWRRQKLLDYTQEYETARQHLALIAGAESPMQPVYSSPRMDDLPGFVIPDTIVVP